MHDPAPSNVTTAAVRAGDPVFVTSPATEQTVGVVELNATTSPEFAVAVIPNAGSPKFFEASELKEIDCAVLLMTTDPDVTDDSPGAEKVSV